MRLSCPPYVIIKSHGISRIHTYGLGHNDVIIGDSGKKSIWILRSEVIKCKALDEKQNAVRELPIFVFELRDMF